MLFDRPQEDEGAPDDEVLEALVALADKNLDPPRRAAGQPGELRFAMLAVLAEFAAKLAAEPELPALQGLYVRY